VVALDRSINIDGRDMTSFGYADFLEEIWMHGTLVQKM
jgi:hypothetical protein